MINLFFNLEDIGHFALSYVIYKLCLAPNEIDSTLYNVENVAAKRTLIKEKSSILWHKGLSHISKESGERLINDNFIPTLDFNELETYVDSCRGELTRINTNISGSYSPTI